MAIKDVLSIPKMGTGVVVSRADPLKLGRAQVRVRGIHSKFNRDKGLEGIANYDLPWYQVMMPGSNGSGSGQGLSQAGTQPGSEVIVMYFDDFARQGYVLGSLTQNVDSLANPAAYDASNGFQDPSGMYPKWTGTSLSPDMSTELGSGNTVPVATRDSNLTIALNPDGSMVGAPPLDDNPDTTLAKMLGYDEGYDIQVYKDSRGFPTIGIGHLLDGVGAYDYEAQKDLLEKELGHKINWHIGQRPVITDEDVQQLFEADVKRTIDGCAKRPKIAAALSAAGNNLPRKWAIWNMAFQMGVAGLNQFTTTLSLMAAGRWPEAAVQAKESAWSKQTPGRANRVAYCIASGNMSAYGITPPSQEAPEPPLPPAPEIPKPATKSVQRFVPVYQLMKSSEELDWTWDVPGLDELSEDLQQMIKRLINEAVEMAEDAVDALVKECIQTYEIILENVGKFKDSMLDKYESAKSMLTPGDTSLKDKIQKWFKDFSGNIIEIATELKNYLTELVEEIWTDLQQKANDAWKLLQQGIRTIQKSMKEFSIKNLNPWDPIPEEKDSAVMWKETPFEGTPDYEYAKVYTSESGYTQIIDDTPDNSRYQQTFANKNYTEQNANGDRNEKIQNDSRSNVLGTKYEQVGADRKSQVMGDAIEYITGSNKQVIGVDSLIQILGNGKLEIKGNWDISVQGNVNIHVVGETSIHNEGNVKIKVDGDVNAEVAGNVNANVKGNVDAIVNGNMSQEVDGDWDVTVGGNINHLAGGNIRLDAVRIDLG